VTTLAYTGGAEYMVCGTEDGAVKCIHVSSGQVRMNTLIGELPYEGRYEATWKREFKLPWREASPPNHLDDNVDSDQ